MANKILVVDDAETNRELLADMLKDEYEIVMADNGRKALELLDRQHNEFAILLLDLIMPDLDGFQVLEYVRKQPWGNRLAIIVISVDCTAEAEKRCLDLGVSDFIHRPFDTNIVKRRVKNVIALYRYQLELENKIDEQTKTLREQFSLLQGQADRLIQSRQNVIDILGNVVEYRDLESGEHIKRVKGYTRILAERMMEDYPEYGLTVNSIDIIVSASALHDIGKIAIPDAILLKPGGLTTDEYEYMKTHTVRGSDFLNTIENVWDDDYGKACYEICRYHHERYDGRGYPEGLKGDEIPISAQIVSLADVYDALVNERVYRGAFTKEEAYRMIVAGECGVFSPKLLDCFAKVRGDFEELAGV